LQNRGYNQTGDILQKEILFQVTDIIKGAVDVLHYQEK